MHNYTECSICMIISLCLIKFPSLNISLLQASLQICITIFFIWLYRHLKYIPSVIMEDLPVLSCIYRSSAKLWWLICISCSPWKNFWCYLLEFSLTEQVLLWIHNSMVYSSIAAEKVLYCWILLASLAERTPNTTNYINKIWTVMPSSNYLLLHKSDDSVVLMILYALAEDCDMFDKPTLKECLEINTPN